MSIIAKTAVSGDCRDCQRTIYTEVPLVEERNVVRVRCAGCRATNYFDDFEPVRGVDV